MRTSEVLNQARKILKPKDKEILEAIYRFRFLSSNQIKKLFFKGNSKTLVSRRVSKMRKGGFIDCFKKATEEGKGSSENIYAIDEAGAIVVAALKGREKNDLLWRKRDNFINQLFVNHYLTTNDFIIEFICETKEKGAEASFLTEIEFREKYSTLEKKREIVRMSYDVSPDAVLFFEGKTIFLEMDMGTEEHPKFRKKIIKYQKFIKENPEFSDARILIITTTQRRLANLKNTLEEEMKRQREEYRNVAGIDIYLLAIDETKENILRARYYKTFSEEKALLFG